MKNVVYSKKELKGSRGRVVSVREFVPDNDCDTAIRKSFVYLTRRAEAVPETVAAPQVRVLKGVDTQAQSETFFMRIKGTVYFKQGRFIHQVDYLHTLAVRMFWKTHVLSSGPAALA